MATDDFNRADANPIGGNWSTLLGRSNMRIVSNAIQALSNAYSMAYWNADSFSENQYSQIQITTVGNYSGVITRVQSDANTCYAWYKVSSTAWRLYKNVSGTMTQIGSSVTYTTLANDTAKLISNGTTHTGYINDVQKISQTDSSISGGAPGVLMYGTAVVEDNWEGGNLVNNLSVDVHDCTDIKTVLL